MLAYLRVQELQVVPPDRADLGCLVGERQDRSQGFDAHGPASPVRDWHGQCHAPASFREQPAATACASASSRIQSFTSSISDVQSWDASSARARHSASTSSTLASPLSPPHHPHPLPPL